MQRDVTPRSPRHTTSRHRLARRLAAGMTSVVALGALPLAPAAAQLPSRPIDPAPFCENVPTAYDPFVDVDDEHTFASTIRCSAYVGLTLGTRAGVYDPGTTVTRAQMAAFVHRTITTASMISRWPGAPGEPLPGLPVDEGPHRFTDVDPDVNDGLTASYVDDLAAAGIVEGGPGGLPATSYGPDLPVTRGQMASYIARSLEHLTGVAPNDEDDHFSDDAGSVHEVSIDVLAARGIVVGDGQRRFRPDDPLSRGQLSAFLVRSLAYLHAIDAVPAHPEVVPAAFEVGSTDNGDGTATLWFDLRDVDNAPLRGVAANEITLTPPGASEPTDLATLLAAEGSAWGAFRPGYSVVFSAPPGTYTFTDVTVRGVEIAASLTVTITGG